MSNIYSTHSQYTLFGIFLSFMSLQEGISLVPKVSVQESKTVSYRAPTFYSIKQIIEKETGKVVLSVEKCDPQKQYLMEAHIDDTGEYTEATLSYPRNDKNFEQLTEMIAPIHKVKGFVQETPMVKATHINHGLSAVLSKDAFFAHEYKEIVDTLYNRFHK